MPKRNTYAQQVRERLYGSIVDDHEHRKRIELAERNRGFVAEAFERFKASTKQ